MNKLLEAIRTRILLSSAVTAIMPASRFCENALEQNMQLPAADMRIVSTRDDTDQDGNVVSSTSVVTIDCYAHDRQTADNLIMAIKRSGIIGYRGVVAGMAISAVVPFSGPSQFDDGIDPGTQNRRLGNSLQLQVTYPETCG